MIDQNHPYYQCGRAMYPKVVNNLLMQRRISQQEANFLMTKAEGPEFCNFIQNCISSIPALQGESHMEKLIYDNLVSQFVAWFRQNMCGAGGGYGVPGGIINPGYGGGYGGRMMYGGPGYAAPGGGGSAWYAGAGSPTAGFQRGPRFISGGYPQSHNAQPTQTKKEEKKPAPKKPDWKEPVISEDDSTNQQLDNRTAFTLNKFVGYDGEQISEAFVVDERPRYLNARNAINAFKNLVSDDASARKFLTVCYSELKLLRVDRSALSALIKAASAAVGNVSHQDVAARVKAIISVSADHPSGAAAALSKLFVDEFNDHVYSGELTDSVKGHLDWTVTASSIDGIYKMLAGDIDKGTRNILHQIKNFDDALKNIVTKVINTVVCNGTLVRIINPIDDKTSMDVYGMVIPPIWRDAKSNVWEATPSIFSKYLSSIRTVNGSLPNSAVVAEQSLKAKLALIDKNFTVVQVPRIITWCNCPSSNLVSWKEDGTCNPRVFGTDTVDNDTAYFLARVIDRVQKSKLPDYQVVPGHIICDVDEGSINLDYGITSDGGLWTGSLRYRK